LCYKNITKVIKKDTNVVFINFKNNNIIYKYKYINIEIERGREVGKKLKNNINTKKDYSSTRRRIYCRSKGRKHRCRSKWDNKNRRYIII